MTTFCNHSETFFVLQKLSLAHWMRNLSSSWPGSGFSNSLSQKPLLFRAVLLHPCHPLIGNIVKVWDCIHYALHFWNWPSHVSITCAWTLDVSVHSPKQGGAGESFVLFGLGKGNCCQYVLQESVHRDRWLSSCDFWKCIILQCSVQLFSLFSLQVLIWMCALQTTGIVTTFQGNMPVYFMMRYAILNN